MNREKQKLPGGFGRLWTAQTASSLGDGVTHAALPLLSVGMNQFTIDYDRFDSEVALVVVPEPASAALLVGGLGALFGVRRRSARQR